MARSRTSPVLTPSHRREEEGEGRPCSAKVWYLGLCICLLTWNTLKLEKSFSLSSTTARVSGGWAGLGREVAGCAGSLLPTFPCWLGVREGAGRRYSPMGACLIGAGFGVGRGERGV